MSDFEGLVALVTGGALGPRRGRRRGSARGRRPVAVLDRDPDGVPEQILAVRADVTDDASVRCRGGGGRPAARAPRHPGQQRRHRRSGHRRGQPRRGVARRPRREPAGHGPGDPGGAAPPAPLPLAGHRQHRLGGRRGRAARAGALQRQQGRAGRGLAGDGGRPGRRRDPRQLCEPRHRRHAVDRPAALPGRGPARRARRPGGSTASRPVGLRRRGRRRRSARWPVREPARRPARA